MTPDVRSRTERTGSLVSGLVAGAVVVGVAALLMLLTTVQGTPQVRTDDRPAVTQSEEPAPAPSSTGEPLPALATDADPSAVRTVILLLLGVVATALLALLVRAVVRAVRRARENPAPDVLEGAALSPAPAADASAVEAQPDAEVIQRGIAAALQRLDDRVPPSDAIVAAWVGVEEAAADSGVIRGVSETPGEFTVRIIARRAAIDSDARRLLSLYERVRFGGYAAQEQDRAEARLHLEQIERGWR